MFAPSLRGRVVSAGVVVVAITLALVSVVVYLSMRQELRSEAVETLQERARLASLLADTTPSEDDLIARLERSNVPARAVLADGRVVETDTVALIDTDRVFVETVPLPGGGEMQVMTSLTRVDSSLAELRLLLGLATVFGVFLATLLLIRASRQALHPLEHMVTTADAIAAGNSSERLRPHRDDTDIGRLAAAFDAMIDAQEAAVQKERETSELNRLFLADAAHQLRTPLAGLQATAELLAHEQPAADGDRLRRNLALGARRVGVLVDALLRMARIDQGQEPELVPCDLIALCREELQRVQDHFPDIEGHLNGAEVNAAVPVDSASIREAIGNLLDNACRHATSRVDVVLDRAGECVRITVADDGPGMDEEPAARAFERFAVFGAGHGAGLGLPIARGIVEAHGGTLEYVDRTFQVRLPDGASGRSAADRVP